MDFGRGSICSGGHKPTGSHYSAGVAFALLSPFCSVLSILVSLGRAGGESGLYFPVPVLEHT
jgi:hypothetical protein